MDDELGLAGEDIEQVEREIQRIAEVCGELSMGAAGLVQYRAVFPPWPEAGEPDAQKVAVPAERIEGLFQAIWLKLRRRPEYQPLQNAINERDRANAAAASLRDKLAAAKDYIAALEKPSTPEGKRTPKRLVQEAIKQARGRWDKACEDEA